MRALCETISRCIACALVTSLEDSSNRSEENALMYRRPHECPECGIRFMYPKDVERHAKAKHEGGASLTCEICSKVLSREDNMQRHLERLHGIFATPHASTESSVASPTSVYSESHHSDASTVPTSPWSEEPQALCRNRSLHQRLLLPASPKDRTDHQLGGGPTSIPISRWSTN